jgi:beta-phosphoglucomutase
MKIQIPADLYLCSLPLNFDMDGVLVDNHQYHFEAWMIFCRKHQIEITADEFRLKMLGGSNRNLLAKVFDRQLTTTEITLFSNEKELIYRQLHAKHIKEVDGVTGFIQQLKKENYLLAVATAACHENLEFVLSALELEQAFDATIDESNVMNGKPDPEVYLKTAARLGVEPRKCVVFEDSMTGIAAAQAAGMTVIGVRTSLDEQSLSHTWKTIPNFNQLNINDLFYDFNKQ